jgi:predicted AlkP superfamily phosphohydrolase/phosphomutase
MIEMTSPDKNKVLVIALDAMELSLAEKLMDQGKLPNLSRLKESGVSTTCHSSADWFVASPWPTFYTGTTPADHGIYHYLLWDPENMSNRRAQPGHPLAEPFWRDLAKRGLKSVVIDAPMLFPAPGADSGIEITGWCTHDTLADAWVYPPAVADRLRADGLQPIKLTETYRPMSRGDAGVAQKQLNLSTSVIRDMGLRLLDSEPWNFALVSFTATHVGGHQFWSDTGLTADAARGNESPAVAILEDIYVNCDAALGELLDAAPEDTIVMAMALHGIEANTNRGDLLPEMLRMILAEPDDKQQQPLSLLKIIRELFPQPIRQAIKSRLPRLWQDRLTSFWRTSGQDWSTVKAFSFLPDLQGYIRINLQGRESKGIVTPGEEYDAICEQIISGLKRFVDADTREPIVGQVMRMDSLYPDHSSLNRLPDIAVNWSATPSARHREIHSPFGNIKWPTPGRNPDGRSGNHTGRGFLFASGPGFEPGTQVPPIDIMDLAPTFYELYGFEPRSHFRGHSVLSVLRNGQ